MLVAASESKHDDPEHKHDHSPPQIDIDIERALVELAITQRSEEHKQNSTNREQHSDWQSDIESHNSSQKYDIEQQCGSENDYS